MQTVDTSGGITDLDAFAEAISLAENVGATVTSFVANPADLLDLARLKKSADSNEGLLQADPTQPTRRQILGVPVIASPAVTVGDVWAIPAAKVIVVMREDVTLAVDPSAYFSSDSIGVRATVRVGYAFPHEAAIVRLTGGGS